MFLISFSFKFKSWQHSDFDCSNAENVVYSKQIAICVKGAIAPRDFSLMTEILRSTALPSGAVLLHLIIAQRFVNVNV